MKALLSYLAYGLILAFQISCSSAPNQKAMVSDGVGKAADSKGPQQGQASSNSQQAESSKPISQSTPLFTLSTTPVDVRCKPGAEMSFVLEDGLSTKNSYLLARMSKLGEGSLTFEPKRLSTWFKNAGFSETVSLVDLNMGVQGVVALSEKMNVVIFRGTHNVQGMLTDVLLGELQAQGGVHLGFNQAYQSIAKSLLNALEGEGKNRPTYFVGHSLGGALALLAALDVHRNQGQVAGVITLGQPRVGNASFAAEAEQILGERHKRYVFNSDIVPHLPPSPGSGDDLMRELGGFLSDKLNLAGVHFLGVSIESLMQVAQAGTVQTFAQKKFTHVGVPERLGNSSYSKTSYESDNQWDEGFWDANRKQFAQAFQNPESIVKSPLVTDHGIENYLCEILHQTQ